MFERPGPSRQAAGQRSRARSVSAHGGRPERRRRGGAPPSPWQQCGPTAGRRARRGEGLGSGLEREFSVTSSFALTECLSLSIQQDELQPEADAETTGTPSPLHPDPPAPPPPSPPPLQDPIKVQSVLRGFLLLMKQLQVFKESWAQRRLGTEVCRTPNSYQQLAKYYRCCGKFNFLV